MATKTEDLFKDYVPETLEYDKEIDGMADFEVREDRLKTKEQLAEKIKAPLTEEILFGSLKEGGEVLFGVKGGSLTFKVAERV